MTSREERFTTDAIQQQIHLSSDAVGLNQLDQSYQEPHRKERLITDEMAGKLSKRFPFKDGSDD